MRVHILGLGASIVDFASLLDGTHSPCDNSSRFCVLLKIPDNFVYLEFCKNCHANDISFGCWFLWLSCLLFATDEKRYNWVDWQWLTLSAVY